MLYKHIGLVEGIGEFVMIWNMNSFPEEAVSPEADIKCSFSLDFLPTFYGPFKGK